MRARILLGLALLATLLVYWVGLHGPFLLDDSENLRPVQDWLSGTRSWQDVVLNNNSGMLGRPLSMLSFLASAALGGYSPYVFKLGNLIIHLLCGVLGWQMLRRAMAEDQALAPNADLIASLLVALWLLHPLNVSTVLYSVQRMAQLGAMFVLASVCVYLVSRRALIEGRTQRGFVGLFILFPLLLAAGLFSKENAAIAPGLCLVFELAYFWRRARAGLVVKSFFAVFVAVPVVFVAGLLLIKPGRLIGGYVSRDFTLIQRLLSEPRALMDYLGQLVLPRNPKLGLFTDDFPVSTSLVSPHTTLWAILGLLALSALVIALRKRAPSVFAGWFFFLVAHAVESGFLPLELYFEHRNYLPAFGLWLALAGLCELLTRNLQTNVLSRRQLGWGAAIGFAAVFAFGAHGRARTWQHEDAIVAQALQTHPSSLRANLAAATLAVRANNLRPGYDALARLQASPKPLHKFLGRVDWVTLDCLGGKGANPSDLKRAVALAQHRLVISQMQAFDLLDRVSADKDCGLVSPSIIADSIDLIVDAATAQPDTALAKWRMRMISAKLYARSGDWKSALPQAELSWQPSAAPAAGAFLVRAYANNGMQVEAERTYLQVAARINRYSTQDIEGLAELRKFLDSYSGSVKK
jgi:hypothetical protein